MNVYLKIMNVLSFDKGARRDASSIIGIYI